MSGVAVTGPTCRRELGTWDCGRPGPTLLVLAGVHGNEPAGVLAVQRVLGRLQELELPVVGRIVALAGNLRALAAHRRFLDRDLNRGWGPDAIAAMLQRDAPAAKAEDHEQRELLARFTAIVRTASGPVVFLDLHTSSAEGPPFLCLADTIDNRNLGLATRVPIILGIEETLDGASLEWFAERGIAAVAVEGGRHEHPDTAGNLEAVLWLALEHLRILQPGQVELRPHREHLRVASAGVPPVVEITQRRAITAADGFAMAPGFVNFQAVKKGELLAQDRQGEIRAPYDCRMMLPLYQALGDDGFFLARPVRRVWLHVAKWLRALRLPAIVTWLPGVRRDPDDRLTILVDRRVARWFVPEVFHLLGFRKVRPRGDGLAFTRRWSRPENARL
ncbi:MAG: succinylglutamate desuccinylase/aspartoacylase family protein [Planctomycetota bacterium]|nr:succinylglutamate desuccinylase/aspartoacylase family protein [Planctomycetota bacterium]